ncbi:hypothetical protein C8R48DRAFT_814960 [Suillus tomentosus]|nr:hypothetical protein C8R48DRAFT_814960 [Suillus tomentosus]
MSGETLSLPAPSDEQAYMYVSALEGGHMNVPLDLILAGDQPDEPIVCPSLAFCLRHSKSNKDIKEFAPAATERFLPTVKQTVAESLEAGGVQPSSVDVVVLSHLHWDHIGDPSLFTTAEFPLHLFVCRKTVCVTTLDLNVAIGPYPCAMDIFGDGSMYIIDASGHVDGHINILACTSQDGAWILLGADSAHHPDLITVEMQTAYRVDPNTCSVMCVHEDKQAAEENIRRMRTLLEVPRVQVLISHDINWYQENKNKDVFLPHIIPPLVVQ